MNSVTTQYLPSYSYGTDAYAAVSQVVAPANQAGNASTVSAVVIGGKRAMAAGLGRLKAACADSCVQIIDAFWYGGEASYENVECLLRNPTVQNADVIFAMGGGKAIDACKVVAHHLNKQVYTFPTIASNCSPVSRISIMYHEDGSFKDIFQLRTVPVHCFVDTQIIAEAPEAYLWAGIGDTIAKFPEVAFSMRGEQLAYAPELGLAIARMCDEPFVKQAEAAYKASKQNLVTDALEQAALNIVVSTGLVSGLVGVNYNCALAHALFYGLTTVPEVEKNHLHGEVVSYGLLVQLTMDNQEEKLQQLLPLYRSLGLPTCLADLDLSADGDFESILEATEVNQELRHVPYPVTKELILGAITKLEELSAECKVPAAQPPRIPES